MQVSKGVGNMDGKPAKILRGELAYWAKRLPRTYQQNAGQFIEKAIEAQPKPIEIKIKEELPKPVKPEKRQRIKVARDIVKPHEIKTDKLMWENFKLEKAHVILEIIMRKDISLNDLIYCVCEEVGVPRSGVVGDRRKLVLVRARAAVSILARGLGYSFPRIGNALGGRDHATIINLVRKYSSNVDVTKCVVSVAELLQIELSEVKK